MSSSKTPNLGLHTWTEEDRFNHQELNDNFKKLDAIPADKITLVSTQFTEKNVKAALESLKSGASDVKTKVANAITGKGVPASPSDTGDQLAAKIGQIPSGTDTSDATATSGDILAPKTAYSQGIKRTGTIPNRGAGGTVIPGTTDQTKAAGYYSSAITIKGSANLRPENIASGIDIFGVIGSAIIGKKVFTTSFSVPRTSTAGKTEYVNIPLDFTPKFCALYHSKFRDSDGNIGKQRILIRSSPDYLSGNGLTTANLFLTYSTTVEILPFTANAVDIRFYSTDYITIDPADLMYAMIVG